MVQLVNVDGADKVQAINQDRVFAEAEDGIVLIIHVHHVERFRLLRQMIIHMLALRLQEQFTAYRLFGQEAALILTITDI
jgi:hypothetical protein